MAPKRSNVTINLSIELQPEQFHHLLRISEVNGLDPVEYMEQAVLMALDLAKQQFEAGQPKRPTLVSAGALATCAQCHKVFPFLPGIAPRALAACEDHEQLVSLDSAETIEEAALRMLREKREDQT